MGERSAEGPAFTVGGDVAAMAQTPPAELPALMRRITGTYHATLQILDRLPVPVVAAVHEALARTGATRDAAHGIASFMAKTRPGFEGR